MKTFIQMLLVLEKLRLFSYYNGFHLCKILVKMVSHKMHLATCYRCKLQSHHFLCHLSES